MDRQWDMEYYTNGVQAWGLGLRKVKKRGSTVNKTNENTFARWKMTFPPSTANPNHRYLYEEQTTSEISKKIHIA